MRTVGIICEYNPFHGGHTAQIRQIRADFGADCTVVCLMSGNYVQRGEPAIFSKDLRAKAAVLCGADLLLELPLTAALRSAEGFAAEGVRILTDISCDALSFGSETADPELLMQTASLLLRPELDERIRAHLQTGCSYPAARALALRDLGCEGAVSQPNDILAVEYCKAILRQKSPMEIHAVLRPGDYNALELDAEKPSATALRAALVRDRERGDGSAVSGPAGSDWRAAVPACLHGLYAAAPLHTAAAGERACLALLRTLPDDAFAALPFGSEGLWSKLMKNCRVCSSVEQILTATKSKRYTLSRIRRMLLCAVLGLRAEDLEREPPYVRVLAFGERGRVLLRRDHGGLRLINAGQTPPDPAYNNLERRASDLYGLFSVGAVSPAGEEHRLRVFCSEASRKD